MPRQNPPQSCQIGMPPASPAPAPRPGGKHRFLAGQNVEGARRFCQHCSFLAGKIMPRSRPDGICAVTDTMPMVPGLAISGDRFGGRKVPASSCAHFSRGLHGEFCELAAVWTGPGGRSRTGQPFLFWPPAVNSSGQIAFSEMGCSLPGDTAHFEGQLSGGSGATCSASNGLKNTAGPSNS